jgi:CubicO group peptidase (beta-lactamase class C family)
MRSFHMRVAIALVLATSGLTRVNADPADDYVQAFMAKYHAPGVALAVIRDGKVVKEATYGYANLEWHQPLTTTAPFWLDSLTKLVTAVGIMQLAEQGKLSLDDPISKYLTDAPAAWNGVTVRHLLAHTSGIKDDYWQDYAGSKLLNYKDSDIYAYATRQPLEFKPGDRYSYDNEGYYLLGLIIAKASGEPYTQWMTEHVLKPAGMKAARMYKPSEIIPNMVSSYELDHGQVAHHRADIMSDRGEAIAGWGIYASLEDLIAFDAALQSGKLISRKSLDAMWTNVRLNSGYPSQSGLGFNIIRYPRGHRQAWKGGQAGTGYAAFPDDHVSIIFLTNMEGSGWQDLFQPAQLASLYDPAIQPISALQPRPDQQPARTAKLKRALEDIASGAAASPLLTTMMSASLTPDFRAQTKQLLGGMQGFQYLGCENASPKDPFGAVTYCYYRTRVPPGPLDLGFGLDSKGRLASGSGQPEQ